MDSDNVFITETENYRFMLFFYAEDGIAEYMFREGLGIEEGNYFMDDGEIFGFAGNILWASEQKFEPLATPVLVSYNEETTEVVIQYDEKASKGYEVVFTSSGYGKDFEYVYPACGSSNSAIKLSIPELEETSKYLNWIDVCKII